MKTAIILAGGQSRRMGFDKAELEIGGTRLVDIVTGKAASHCEQVFISGSTSYGLEFESFEDAPDVPKGPAAGILTAAARLSGKVEGFFSVPVDSPNFPDDLFGKLYNPVNSSVACDDNGLHPTFGWWRIADLKAALERLNPDQSLSLNRLADLCGAQEIHWPGSSLFYNINSANDLTRYLTEIESPNMR